MANEIQDLKEGNSNYHESLNEVHIIVFTLKNLFKDKDLREIEKCKFNEEFFFHKKVVPIIKEYNKPISDNKMFWDYIDLKNF